MNSIASQSALLPYNKSKELLVEDHTIPDIVKAIKVDYGLYRHDYDEIAPEYWNKDVRTTCNDIFRLLRNGVTYKVEPDSSQSVKSPGAILSERHGDCKHYASFITGVCAALEREGYPIKAKYRFVSDSPDKMIHHVFAVVQDKNTGREYWVDPVLSRFDDRPKFHNIEDVSMKNTVAVGALYRISGLGDYGAEATYPGGPKNLPQVWGGIGKKAKKKKTNIFKKIAHGMDVNAHNIKHGIDVNAHNAVKAVKTITLKVGMEPARGSFLALVDLNAFNLATRLADTIRTGGDKRNKLFAKWKDIGGEQKGLVNAVNNGIKHKAAVHHQAPAKHVSGDLGVYLVNRLQHPGGYHRPMRVYHPGYEVRTLHEAYAHPYDDRGNLPRVSGIGVVVAIPALLALASALIAVLKPYLKASPKDDADMVKGAHEGVHKMVKNTSDATDMSDTPGGDKLVNDVSAGGQPSMNVTTGIDPETGNPTLQVNAVDHPQINNAGQYVPGSNTALIDPNANDPGSAGEQGGPDPSAPNSLVNVPANVGTDFMRDVIGPIKDQVIQIWNGYKVPIMAVGAGVIIYKFKTRKKGRRR